MTVILKYTFENESEELLSKAKDFFMQNGMDTRPDEGFVYAEKEEKYTADEQDSEHYFKIALQDCWTLAEIIGTGFSLSGVIDTSYTAGECMDFRFDCAGGSIAAKASDWYVETSMDSYESYEDFCEGFFDCTREEYEIIKGCEFVYILETGDGDILSCDVPLYKVDI